EITFDGARFGSIEHWSEGIITRGVMLDVPRHRGVPCVTQERPVHGWELEDLLVKRGIRLEPGDAVCVYAGREAWQAQDPERPYSKPFGPIATLQRPGLHVSCLPFLRDHDVSVLVWDMLDHLPIGYDIPWAVHAAIFAYGVALLDNALLEPLAKACAEEGRDEFMLVISPLPVTGGTGSPANPLAVFWDAHRDLERQLAEGPAREGHLVARARPARSAADAGDEARRRRRAGRRLSRGRLQAGAPRGGTLER